MYSLIKIANLKPLSFQDDVVVEINETVPTCNLVVNNEENFSLLPTTQPPTYEQATSME